MLTTVHAKAIAALIAAACLLGAYATGRATAPAKVVTRDVVTVETQYRDRVQVQQVHDVAIQHDVQVQTRTVTVTRWTPSPAGPVIVQETHQEAESADKGTVAAETKMARQSEVDARQMASEVRTVTVTAERPQWSVTALAGASLGSPPHLVPGLPGTLVVGAAVERRILGPISAGLWATSSGAGGVSVRLEF